MGTWWWIKPKVQDYSFTFTPDGWQASGKGFNPFETFGKMVDNFTGRNKPLQQVIDDAVRDTTNAMVKQRVMGRLQESKNLDGYIDQMIKQAFEKHVNGDEKTSKKT